MSRPTDGRVLGIDLGERRVGVALSDGLGITAQPHAVIERSAELLADLRSIVDEEDVVMIVVGLPLTLGGEMGAAAEAAAAEAEEMGEKLGVPVELWDERLTTVTAERALIESGVRREDRRRVVDKVAAAVMLQSYLDNQRGNG